MVTYKEVQRFVRQEHRFVPKTCWIADVLELNGHRPRLAPNRADPHVRQVPCPIDKRPAIEHALRHFHMI